MDSQYSADITISGIKNKKERKSMRKAIGVIVIILSIALGLYLGIGVMLIGGVNQIVSSVNPLVEAELTAGIIKVLLASTVGWTTAILGTAVGSVIADAGDEK